MREMITSTVNKKIKDAYRLLKKKNRKEMGLFIIEGDHLVEEAIKAKVMVEVFTSNENKNGTLVAPHIIKKLTDAVSPQDIVAVCKKPEVKKLGNKVVALDMVQDPGNVGTIIRTALAFGFTDVVVRGSDVYSPKALRSSQGALFGINVIQTNDISAYFYGYQVIGAILDKDAKSYKEVKLEEKMILVLGNEGKGISKEVIEKLSDKVYIPINFESLNVASAGAILMNEYGKGE
ncbi:MAG: RNA methyltransferase [Mycoplasmataceae bacterium]|nr:RNA methyltransferase [Mycoplasmataceae bacterium]